MKSKKHNKIIGIIILLVLILAPKVEAQNDSIPKSRMPVQFTVLFPLGTNGLHSYHYINNASFNLLVGYSGGVEGLELGGIANIINGDVTGAQAAGLFNISTGNLKGLQMAGLGNYNKGTGHGVIASGIANVHEGPMTGLQMAGITNVSLDTITGIQASGISNVNIGSVTGIQMAGISNLSLNNFNGVQASGIANVHVGDLKGLQFSGIANVSTKSVKGSQIGLTNYTKDMKGFQFGLVNTAVNFNGFQLGLINIADSIGSGAGLGLINYYSNGYHKFEVEANETFYANLTFKSGVEKLYVIYTVGVRPNGHQTYWAPGLGVGSLFHLSDRVELNTDLIARQVNEGEWWTDNLNMLNTIKLNVSYKITERFSIYGGPSLNIVVSDIKDIEGNVIGDSFSKNSFYDKTFDNHRVKMYMGFSGGIRF